MKTRIIVAIIAIVLQLAVAFLPVLPVLKSLAPKSPNSREQLDFTVQVVGFSFSILTAYLALIVLLGEYDTRLHRRELMESINGTRVVKMRDDEFYEGFLNHVRQAESYVYVSYLAPYPPTDTGGDARKKYYKNVQDAVKKRVDVRFRRLTRRTKLNDPWLKDLIGQLEGQPNADLAVIDELETADNPLALSVQLIDDRHVWMVALDSHERAGPYRDLYIDNAEVAEGMRKYYDRLWTRSEKLVESGRVTSAGIAVQHPTRPRIK